MPIGPGFYELSLPGIHPSQCPHMVGWTHELWDFLLRLQILFTRVWPSWANCLPLPLGNGWQPVILREEDTNVFSITRMFISHLTTFLLLFCVLSWQRQLQGERVYVTSHFKVQSIIVGKSGQLQDETVGPIKPTVREQRGMNARMLASWLPFSAYIV